MQNPRAKHCLRLRERRERRESGLMLVEGYHELALAWRAGVAVETLYFCPGLARPEEQGLLAEMSARGVEVVELGAALMAKLGYREHPDAWLAVARTPKTSLADLDPGPAPLLLLAENLEKPGNLGAILRSADAAGVDAVLVCEGRTDVYNPNVVRASKGCLFALPVVECSNAEALGWLRARGVAVLAATPEATAAHWDADLRRGVAIAVGAEKEGLSPFWMERADQKILIPMQGRVNSLNVAQAATLVAYEARRQRAAR